MEQRTLLHDVYSAFGCVYTAKHHVFEDEPAVAVKLIRAHPNVQQEYDQFLQEARTQRKIKHPHILPVLGAGLYEGFYYLILEYAPNKSLRDLLHRYAPKPIPTDKAIMILSQIGQALQYAHEMNIVHRDLKPENILFNANDEALLADFGIAVVLERTQLVDGSGTPPYMAPEQFEKRVSQKSDQYALACLAYELLTGRRPFEADNVVAMGLKHKTEPALPPRQLNPNLPLHIERAILTAMAKGHNKRHENVSQFIEALQMSSEQWKIEGDMYYRASHNEDALGAYERAIQLDSSNASAYCGKGDVLCVLKRYEEALAEYERALQRDPDYASAYYGKGNALVSRHRSAEALMAYERALQLGFSKALVHCGKGEVFCALLSYHEALASYEWALLCDPNCAPAYRGKGHALYSLKCY
jgi:serine/threonine protein kinase